MGSTQVNYLHPVQIDGDLKAPVTVRNESAVTVYYLIGNPGVSGSNSSGNLTEHQEVTLYSATWFVTKTPTTAEQEQKLVPSAELRVFPVVETEDVQTANLANSSVTEPKLGTSVVSVNKTKVKVDAVPTGTESLTAVIGTSGVGRIVSFGYSAKKEANAKVKLVHNLGTTAVEVQAYTTATKVASERLASGSAAAGAVEKIKVVSANEIELTLVAAEPAAKEEFIYIVTG